MLLGMGRICAEHESYGVVSQAFPGLFRANGELTGLTIYRMVRSKKFASLQILRRRFFRRAPTK
jgi:hypothetical protein